MTRLRAIALLIALGASMALSSCGDGCTHGSVSTASGYHESWKICTDENGNRTIE